MLAWRPLKGCYLANLVLMEYHELRARSGRSPIPLTPTKLCKPILYPHMKVTTTYDMYLEGLQWASSNVVVYVGGSAITGLYILVFICISFNYLLIRAVISKSVFRYRKVPFYPTNINNVSFYGKFIDIDIDAQY